MARCNTRQIWFVQTEVIGQSKADRIGQKPAFARLHGLRFTARGSRLTLHRSRASKSQLATGQKEQRGGLLEGSKARTILEPEAHFAGKRFSLALLPRTAPWNWQLWVAKRPMF